MPLIQADFKQGLTDKQKRDLAERLVSVVHSKLGSSIPHISVIVRDWPSHCIAEAGHVGPILETDKGKA